MAGEDAFKVEGVVVEVLPKQLFRVELPNGHRLVAYPVGRSRKDFSAKPGDRLKVQLSPYDLSEGRIVVESKQI